MVMAQGFTREQFRDIRADVDGSELIDAKIEALADWRFDDR